MTACAARSPASSTAPPVADCRDGRGLGGWTAVYGGIVQAQDFVSTGASLDGIELRAWHAAGEPRAPLVVEIRDASLERVFVRGEIAADAVGPRFEWVAPRVTHRARLAPGRRYVIIAYSSDSRPASAWILNEIYDDLAPDTRHLGTTHDLFYRLRYADAPRLEVAPCAGTEELSPCCGDPRGMADVPAPLALHRSMPAYENPSRVQAALAIIRGDPEGPLPEGHLAGDDPP